MKRTAKRTIDVNEYGCDVCGKDIPQSGLRHGVYSCRMCKRDLCDSCVAFDDRAHGDHPPLYCESCWEIGAPYRENQRVAEATYERMREQAQEMWLAAVKNKQALPAEAGENS